MKDGGYYAIKGFDYQIDKTILEVLKQPNGDEEVAIEQIQDINTNSYVIQVKYKETQKYTPSKIKDPLIQLIEEFAKSDENRAKTYYLYCYFEGRGEEVQSFNVDELDKVLGNKKDDYDKSDKEQFAESFVLVFSPSFQDQFMQAVGKIKDSFNCAETEEAIVHYAAIVYELRALVTNNTDPNVRVCTKNRIVEIITNNKALIFESGLRCFMDEQQRLKLIKQKFPKLRRNHDNFIFLGDLQYDSSINTAKLVCDFIHSYFDKACRDIKPPSIIVSDNQVGLVKDALIAAGVDYSDGYEDRKFSYDLFIRPPVVNAKTARNGRATDSLGRISFQLRLVSLSTYFSIQSHTLKPDMAYLFSVSDVGLAGDAPFIKVDCLSANSISKLLNGR